MTTDNNDTASPKKISRKGFLRIAASTAAGGLILGGVAPLAYKMLKDPEDLFFDDMPSEGGDKGSVSPFRKSASFAVDGEIVCFEQLPPGRGYAICYKDAMALLSSEGKLLRKVPLPFEVMDMAVYGDELFILHPSSVSVVDFGGNILRSFTSCDDSADHCAITAMKEGVFITDAAGKHIAKYGLEGTFVKFINSPSGFVVPSYSFAITHLGSTVYCSNPGRHTVESYTPDGEFITSFGKTGPEEGEFCGCCNPVYLTTTPSGELITSEKGISRVSCYSREGHFRSILLDGKALGTGSSAVKVRVGEKCIIAATKRELSFYTLDPGFLSQSPSRCGRCKVECPLKSPLTV